MYINVIEKESGTIRVTVASDEARVKVPKDHDGTVVAFVRRCLENREFSEFGNSFRGRCSEKDVERGGFVLYADSRKKRCIIRPDSIEIKE